MFLSLAVFMPGIFSVSSAISAKEPVKVIFDTDIGNDIDDTLALGMLHNFQNRGDIELVAVTITKDNKYAAAFTKMVNTFYGHPDIPIGLVQGSGIETKDGLYLKETLESVNDKNELMYPNYREFVNAEYPDATSVLRQVLAASEDHSIVIAQVGFSTNLARLLDSPADDISPLTGKELAQQKVREVIAMAGAFTEDLKEHPEYNVAMDVPSAQKFFAEWPGPILVSGFEIGRDIFMTGLSAEEDYNYVPYHPVKIAYWFYGRGKERSTWDLTTVLYAARSDRNYFGFSEPGTVHVRDNGTTYFEPNLEGNTRIFTATPEQKARIQEAFQWICSEMQREPNKAK